ncbi:unnamed protein product [Peronospora belbahrii]|uniref:Myosin-like protein n=1 Tax=Peronospora belbahrii TaxID=622444 RepID=A0AAU9KTW8_9STRA|nr:unnamed protein product [Peronospora belbahrii]
MDKGARVWISDSENEHVWLAARVLEVDNAVISVEIENQLSTEPSSRLKHCDLDNNRDNFDTKTNPKQRDVVLIYAASGECTNVLPRNMPREQDQRDLVSLPHLHEASILNALRLRYERHAIYTHIGDILISINPFQNLPQLYSNDVLKEYTYDHSVSQFGDRIPVLESKAPHLFAVAKAAYMDIVQNARSQAILISGESGAGKTEATKIIMTYFAAMCGTGNNVIAAESVTPLASPSYTTIEEQVLQSNPILEAFGNARTVRNDNSSRFGKFIELRFRDERRKLAGARIRTYLLEKIRVIKQATNERNFHIFYELLSADITCVSKEEKQALAINGGPQSFRLLNQSMCSKRQDGVMDAVQFRVTRRAMQQLGMSEREIRGVLEIVAAVLHMGNVDFEQAPHKLEDNMFSDEARIVMSAVGLCNHFAKAAELLGVSMEALDHALTKRWLHTSNETLVVGVDVIHARNTRNALTMECYRLLFDWLVARVNNKLQRQAVAPLDADQFCNGDEDSTVFIGLLDIFGFEDMTENSFEQLCINYANEALQHQFNQYIFEEEQRLYRDEGIRWNFVDFPNNSACLELYEHRPIGIFSLTDQECVFPQGTDRALVAKYYQEFEKKTQHPHFRSASVLQRATQFVVAHYAGRVTYTVNGFLAKNKDSLCESAAQLLAGSSNPLVQALAAGKADEKGVPEYTELDRYGGRTRRRAKSTIAAVSVGTQFKIQLNELLATVRATTPRYVRCIKPNDSHVSSLFESTRVVEQLRSGGVLEAVRVARAGFPVRLSHQQFLGRYRRVLLLLCKSANKEFEKKHRRWGELDLCLHQLTQVLLAEEEMQSKAADEEDIQSYQMRCGVSLGKTRVFFRRKPYDKLESLRVTVRQGACLIMQAHIRGYIARRSYRRVIQVTVAIQARVRGCLARRYVCWLRAMQQARTLQLRMRQLCARSKFLRARGGVLAVQCLFRCRQATRAVQVIRELQAAIHIATAWRRSFAQRKYRRLCRATLALQCAMRFRLAKRAVKVLRGESRNISKLKEDNVLLREELAELRRQMQVMVAHSVTRACQQLSLTADDLACNSPQKTVMSSSDEEDDSNKRDCENQLDLKLSEGLVPVCNGGNIIANGCDVGYVDDLRFSQQKLNLKTETNPRRSRRYSLPPVFSLANDDVNREDSSPSASPRAFWSRDRRHSLDLWRLQQMEAQKEACQLREAILEASADEPSPERRQQQEIALQRLVASQIKRKTMQLQLQVPEMELKVNNNFIDSVPVSRSKHNRHSHTVNSPLQLAAPLTSCGEQRQSRWNLTASCSMARATSDCMPAYFENLNYADTSCADNYSMNGEDDLYSHCRYPIPRRSASSRLSSNGSSCYAQSVVVRPGVTVPRFAKASTCFECDCAFSILARRHHCRQCGNTFCYEHSTRQLALPHLGYVTAQRVCDMCFEAHIQAMTSFKLPSLVRHPTDDLSTSSFASSPRGPESNDSYYGLKSSA